MTPKGYAIADGESRLRKARKIEALLGGEFPGLDVLDLGAGSGLLADYFYSRGANVTAADRSSTVYTSNIPLTLITGDTLPFADARFDVVILNHVIEHVGDSTKQAALLREIRRILKPSGRLYLAVPNKWAPIEPHFRLPLLGALPRPLANLAVRTFHGEPIYDCYPLARGELTALLRSQFASVHDVSSEAVTWIIEHELRGLPQALLRSVPKALFRLAGPAYPTFIMICSPATT